MLEGVAIINLGCDFFFISYIDLLVVVVDGECFCILCIWEVINWCDYDVIDIVVVICCDEDCDGLMGEEDVWFLGCLDFIYVDVDSLVLNIFLMVGVKDIFCDGIINLEGYWRIVDNIGCWVYMQVICIEDNGFDVYVIYLLVDSIVFCDDLFVDFVWVYGLVCDFIIISYMDMLIVGEGEVCYCILCIWEVINWDEYDGLFDVISICCDEDCDGQLGEDIIWVFCQFDIMYVDVDSLFLNNFLLVGVKDIICDSMINLEGYWCISVFIGCWIYIQILYVIDEEVLVVVFEQLDLFCSFEGDICDVNVIYLFVLDGKCLLDILLLDFMVEMIFWVFLDVGVDGMFDMDVIDFVDIIGSYLDYVINGKFLMGEYILEFNVVDVCGNFIVVNLLFEVVDCFVCVLQCFDDLFVELQLFVEFIDIDGDGMIDQVFVDIMLEYLFEVMLIDDCNGFVGYVMNFMGEVFSMEQNKFMLICLDNDIYEVEVWVFDKVENLYVLQFDGFVGGCNLECCVIFIIVMNFDVCLVGLAGVDKDEEKGVVVE